MKKIILSLFILLSLTSTSIKPTFAQVQPGTGGQCPRGTIGCNSSSGKLCYPVSQGCPSDTVQQTMVPGGIVPTDDCSYVCRGSQQAIECVRCRDGELTPMGGGNVSDPMAGCDAESINTAIGCIPVGDTNSFMGWILGWAVGIGGGIAFLLIVYASFMIMTSQGVPDRLKAGQELLTSAISGLIMLIFSVFILKFIGIDILGLDSL
ncbi:MAG: hypothetical protein QY322_03200 [bacterium]|nr:MAG: hypothetical protein QY322_03200 [bacterium]